MSCLAQGLRKGAGTYVGGRGEGAGAAHKMSVNKRVGRRCTEWGAYHSGTEPLLHVYQDAGLHQICYCWEQT